MRGGSQTVGCVILDLRWGPSLALGMTEIGSGPRNRDEMLGKFAKSFVRLILTSDVPRLLRSPSSPHRILTSRWSGSDARADERGGENENASGGDHRSWQSFWRDRFLSMRQGGRD